MKKCGLYPLIFKITASAALGIGASYRVARIARPRCDVSGKRPKNSSLENKWALDRQFSQKPLRKAEVEYYNTRMATAYLRLMLYEIFISSLQPDRTIIKSNNVTIDGLPHGKVDLKNSLIGRGNRIIYQLH